MAAPRAKNLIQHQHTIWHILTFGLLLVGYMGYYLCRTNWAVITPLILQEYDLMQMTKAHIQWIGSVGIAMYMIGKVVNGVIGDFAGGKIMFVAGMASSVIATLFMGFATGFTVLLVGWAANRLAQSMGWGAIVKTTALWFSHWQYGRIMGFLSLSFLFGDSLARVLLGELIEQGVGWRGIVFYSAAILSGIALLTWWFMPHHPRRYRIAPAVENPRNLFRGHTGSDDEQPHHLWDLLRPYLGSRAFWLVAIMSFGLTGMREIINQWSATYLNEVTNLSAANAARYSALFSFVGGISAVLAGILTDRFTHGKKGAMILWAMVALMLVFLFFFLLGENAGIRMTLVGLSVIGFLLIGPYTFLAGAIVLDLGGKRGTATGVGLVDGIGYLGALVTGIVAGILITGISWHYVFLLLTLLSLLTATAAWLYWKKHETATLA